LDGTAWLGSADQWGLLGLPLEGGPVTYRRAGTLESPTWAPPELEPLAGAWPAEDAIWVRFPDARIAQYEYATGHLLTWDSMPATEQAVALAGARQLVIAPEGRALEHVGPLEPWRFELDAPLVRVIDAGEGWVLAVLDGESGAELVVVEPPADTALGRRQVSGLADLAITAWGDRLYYLSGNPEDAAVHALSLPGLEDADRLELPEAGSAVVITPSAHRLYVAVADSLRVFDLLRDRELEPVALPERVTSLRFSITGSNLLARLEGAEDRVAVLRVGVDSLLGVVSSEWDEDLPTVVPGGRLVARLGSELVLHDASTLVELARSEVGTAGRWFTVEWQPPRPRQETSQRPQAPLTVRAMPRGDSDEEAAELDPEAGAPDGFYAVVSAARERTGVENLVTWLRSVEYPGVVDVHVDPMGVTWYRAMVGPYLDRDRAEEAAQSLGARYGYKPWILSVSRADDEDGPENEQPRGDVDSDASPLDENTRLRSQGGGDSGDAAV
jgi:cell division septation protein DedD